MRILALAGPLALLGLAGCSAGPDSYATMTNGVGFGNYQRYLHERESARSSSAPYSVPPEVAQPAILPPSAMPSAAPSTLDAVPQRARPVQTVAAPFGQPAPTVAPINTQTLAPVAAAPLAAPMQTAARQPAPQPAPQPQDAALRTVHTGAGFGTTPAFEAGDTARPGVSDEQSFQAVSARETIASDRERLARQRAQYQVIEVDSVPAPSEHGGPNIVAYALSVSHAPGTEVYRRINPLRWSRWENACLQYRNQDAAQSAFLADGGPERDRNNLDPDGDGYACWWDPTPLRQALASR
ncbi:hypothetical protein [Pararhodobacter zhoushanensis]|uniref:hypothetical protein n=1 Tax=Pararhodobacter zhoushanensis TaxID=2479545 RepID=UPI000F8D4306|nr:hypothetical protein [Pararhodobacter zhoushanensis]